MAVYFIQKANKEGLIKIGKSKDVSRRLMEIRHLSSDLVTCLLEIDGYGEEEKILHKVFAKDRVHGEWFRPSPALLEFIKNPVPVKDLLKFIEPDRPKKKTHYSPRVKINVKDLRRCKNIDRFGQCGRLALTGEIFCRFCLEETREGYKEARKEELRKNKIERLGKSTTIYVVYNGKLIQAEVKEMNESYLFSEQKQEWGFRLRIKKSEAYLSASEAIKARLDLIESDIIHLEKQLVECKRFRLKDRLASLKIQKSRLEILLEVEIWLENETKKSNL